MNRATRRASNRRFLVFVVLMLLCTRLSAQIPGFRLERGVFTTGTQNSGAFVQDTDGFLWIGTNAAGLYRYDGYELRGYKPGGPNSISDAYIYALFVDRDGTIWIGTGGGGLNRYDKETDTFTRYRHEPDDPHSISFDSWEFTFAQTICQDRTGTLWFGTTHGLNSFRKSTEVFTRYFSDPDDPGSLSNDSVRALLVDSNDTLWIGTNGGGLNRLTDSRGPFEVYRYEKGNPGSLGSDTVTALLEDRDGYIWVGTDRGISRLDPGDGTFTRFQHDPLDTTSLRSNVVRSIRQDSTGTIWITYQNVIRAGVSVYDPEHGSFLHTDDTRAGTGFGAESIVEVFEDDVGTIWFINDVGSVDKFDRRTPLFHTITQDPEGTPGLPHPSVVPIIEDHRGNVWIGTFPGGLTRYNRHTGEFVSYMDDAYFPGVYEDETGLFWLGSTVPGNLHTFDPDCGCLVRTYEHDPADPSSLALNTQINAITQDRNDRDIFWIAASGAGIERFDRSTDTFTHYAHDPQDENSLSNNGVWMLYQDREGILWIPTLGGGLDRFDPATGAFRHFVHDPEDPATPSSNSMNLVFEDSSGYLWIGTAAGFDRFERDTGTFTRFTEETGFPVTSIMGINEDADGELWMGSAGGDGLIRFDPRTFAMRIYRKEDGLQSNVFYVRNAMKDSDGYLWFGGVGGLSYFDPSGIVDNPEVPRVVVTALKQGGETMDLSGAPERTRSITLDWRQNFFEFEYAALAFLRPRQNTYRYMLEGLEKEWYDAGTRRFGRYSGLRGGTYTLRIIAANNDGLWNEEGVSLRIVVTRPFWQRWWAIALAAGSVCAFFAAIYVIKANQVRSAQSAANALRESEERYRTLFENTPVGVAVCAANGEFVAFNGSWARLTGIADFGGGPRKLAYLFSEPWVFDDLLARINRNGAARDYQTLMKRSDGSVFNASLNVTPINLEGGYFYLSVLDDITERRRSEGERDRLLARIRQIIDAVPEGVFMIDDAGTVLLANPAAERLLDGLGSDGETIRALLGGRSPSDFPAPPSGEPWHELVAEKTPDRIFEIAASPIGIDASPESWVLVVREVTREREMQARVRQQEKLAAVGQLTAGIAHDFNNLLTAINGFAELGRIQSQNEAEIFDWTGSILEAGDRAAELVRQLLTFGRKQVVSPRMIDLNELLGGRETMLRRVIGEHVILSFIRGKDLWLIHADPTQIEQIVLNLAINARDAMPEGGYLTIETANVVLDEQYVVDHVGVHPGEYVRLTVSDTGSGMSDSVKEHLFEPFFTTKAQGKGTGLGLSTVFGIVSQCKGNIEVISTPGEGSTFRIHLPRAHGEVSQPSLPSGEIGMPAGGNRTILLVEDASGVREFVRRVLEHQGYQVIPAEDGQEALRIAEEHSGSIDLLLTDVIMPGISGKALAEKILGLRPRVRTLFMSGYSDSVISHHGVIESGVALIQKPFGSIELIRKIEEVLESS